MFKNFETLQVETDESGKVTREKKNSGYFLPNEPEYIKLYLQDILVLNGLAKSQHDLLFALLREMNWKNRVYVQGTLRQQLLKDLDIKPATFAKALDKFVEQEIFYRESRGVYLVNPHLFGRGKWENIRDIQLTVNYKPGGRKVTANIKKPTDLPTSNFDDE